jgi:hypothetical protein
MIQKEDEEYYGPFDSMEEAMEDAMETHNYKISFCSFLETNFRDRNRYKKDIIDSEDNFELNIFSKNRYNNFLKFFYSTFESGIFNEKIVHHILLQLLQTEEIEQFIFIFDILNKSSYKLDKQNLKFYEDKIIGIMHHLRLSAKTKFKLQEYFKIEIKHSNSFDILASLSSNENTADNDVPSKTIGVVDRNMNCIITEYPLNQDYENVKKMFVKIIDYTNFYNTIIQEILDVNDVKCQYLIELMGKLWDDYGKFGEEFEKFLLKKLMNDYNNLEVDYPNCGKIFLELITSWMKKNNIDSCSENFINKLKENHSDDDDEMYSIELFNKRITCSLCNLLA